MNTKWTYFYLGNFRNIHFYIYKYKKDGIVFFKNLDEVIFFLKRYIFLLDNFTLLIDRFTDVEENDNFIDVITKQPSKGTLMMLHRKVPKWSFTVAPLLLTIFVLLLYNFTFLIVFKFSPIFSLLLGSC